LIPTLQPEAHDQIMKNTTTSSTTPTTNYSLTFLAGALVPTIAIYCTGGSNRMNLLIGLGIGLSLVLIPMLRFRSQFARGLKALDSGLEAFYEAFRGSPSTSTSKPAPAPAPVQASAPAPAPVTIETVTDPMVGDVASALYNLGTPRKKAERIALQVHAHQAYAKFEDMFKDALEVAKVA
jgi:hypothetical protein